MAVSAVRRKRKRQAEQGLEYCQWSRDVGPGPSSSHIVAHQTVGTSEIPWLLARFVGLAKQKVRSERSERSSAGYSREIRAD